MLKFRLLFGSIMIAASLGVLVFDNWLWPPLYPLTAIILSVIVWIAAKELCVLFRQLDLPVRQGFCQFGCVLIMLSNWAPHLVKHFTGREITYVAGLMPPFITFIILGMAAFLLAAREFTVPGTSVLKVASHLLILFYVGVFGSFVAQLRWYGNQYGNQPEMGSLAVFLTIFTAKTCDMGAYFIGRSLGKNKIFPTLSPGKTWEGSIGGLIVAIALAIATVAVGKWIMDRPLLDYSVAAVFGLVIGIVASLGDLMESMIKRDCGSKDASNSIPGFGGLLDVIDSVIFCAPVAYLLLVIYRLPWHPS